MTPKELSKAHQEVCYKLFHLTADKNADYSGQHGNAFNNFVQIENYPAGVSTEQAFFVRLSDKMSRLASFIGGKELLVKDEAVADTLEDLANYAILLRIYLKDKKERADASELERKAAAFKRLSTETNASS